ncbi:hypothetical protein QRD02_10735 [Aequorivita sp. SDUM287046]|uniref:Uncharacterized protein n=1 Tax=Aequorivita aurantiaca TaxID=3053356 RepID=A0ABT8DHI3_9FLAO|nr:hypothetical protein [Aequorivita aurantiaca]MDN3724860.1 hypothetical protein [Aequorivita aurantiaca]
MERRNENIRAQLRKLIVASCQFEQRPSKAFRKFHKLYLQFFFGAMDINIDYQTQVISIWNSRPMTTNPVRLFDINDAISDRIYYTNLEETLFGAIEEGPLQDCFYEKILMDYAHYSEKDDDGDGAWSA